MDLAFYNYEFETIKNILHDIQVLKLTRFIQLFCIYNGIIRIQFNDNHKTI